VVLRLPGLSGTTDRDAALALARATAAQFQCYIFDVNGLGAGGVGKSCVVDPTSMVLHQSAGQEDMFPIEIDLSMVRRQRETGMKGLGQVLKSFRDRSTDFSVYDRNSGTDAYLRTLGPLEIPQQGNRAGLHVDVPAQRVPDVPAFKGQDAMPGFANSQPEFAPEPLPNPSAGTAAPAATIPSPPVKPGILTGTEETSSG
jgi:hypothetical protein